MRCLPTHWGRTSHLAKPWFAYQITPGGEPASCTATHPYWARPDLAILRLSALVRENSKTVKTGFLLLLPTLLATPLIGASITYSDYASASFGPYPDVGGRLAVSVPLFNAAKGKLEGVHVTGWAIGDLSITFENRSEFEDTGIIDYSAGGAVSDDLTSAELVYLGEFGWGEDGPIWYDLEPEGSVETMGRYVGELVGAPHELWPVGPGNLTVIWQIWPGHSVTGFEYSESSRGRFYADLSIEVTYEYTPVPEATSWSLIATGLLAFSLRSLRNRRRLA